MLLWYTARAIDINSTGAPSTSMNATTTPGGAVGRDDHVFSLERTFEVVDLERDVGDGLDEIGIRRVGVIALPLDFRTHWPDGR
jgi:hypothetical protein